jgi:hypothetical protein
MSLHDYRESLDIEKEAYSFKAIIMAAMNKAQPYDHAKLIAAFPAIWSELKERLDHVGGILEYEV